MSARRVDKSDPKMVAAVRPLTLPKAWVENQRVGDYEALLATMTYVKRMESILLDQGHVLHGYLVAIPRPVGTWFTLF